MITNKHATRISVCNRMNIFSKPKSSQGHVEIIFSFVIFISFLSFLLIAFNPFKTTGNTEAYLNLAQTQIEKLITKEVSLLTLNIDSSVSGCGYFDYGYTGDENIITKNSSGYLFASNHIPQTGKYRINVNFPPQTTPPTTFYYIYFSKDFLENYNPSSCEELLAPDLGLLRTYSVVSFKEMNGTFSKNYTRDYINLKKQIGIPETKDFSLTFYDLTRTSIKELGTPPEKAIIYAREIPVQFMYETGEFKYGFMQIKIW